MLDRTSAKIPPRDFECVHLQILFGAADNIPSYRTSSLRPASTTYLCDNGIPISALLTSASVHDSQVAIPLATITAGRIQNLYDLMDSAYHVPEIEEYRRWLEHVPLIDVNPRRNAGLKEALESEGKARETLNWEPADAIRYNERTAAERTNARLKDEFGGRTLRVRGAAKAFCHLMIGVLVLTADQLMRMTT